MLVIASPFPSGGKGLPGHWRGSGREGGREDCLGPLRLGAGLLLLCNKLQ